MPGRKSRSLPPVGSRWERDYHEKRHVLEVVSVDPRTRRVTARLGRETYSIPSAAARALTGFQTNGWVFWRLDETWSSTG